MSALEAIQAAIDMAWTNTDDPDECAALSAANEAIEQVRGGVAKALELSTQRGAIMDVESETGVLDADAIHGVEDDACELVAWLATL